MSKNKSNYNNIPSYKFIQGRILLDQNLISPGTKNQKVVKWLSDKIPDEDVKDELINNLELDELDYDEEDVFEITESSDSHKKQFQSQALQDKILMNSLYTTLTKDGDFELKSNFNSLSNLSLTELEQEARREHNKPILYNNVRLQIKSDLSITPEGQLISENLPNAEPVTISLSFPAIKLIPKQPGQEKPTLKIYSIMGDKIVAKDVLTKIYEKQLLTNFGEDFSKSFNLEFVWQHPNKSISADKSFNLDFYSTSKFSLQKSKTSKEVISKRKEIGIDKIMPDLNTFLKNPIQAFNDFYNDLKEFKINNEENLEQIKLDTDGEINPNKIIDTYINSVIPTRSAKKQTDFSAELELLQTLLSNKDLSPAHLKDLGYTEASIKMFTILQELNNLISSPEFAKSKMIQELNNFNNTVKGLEKGKIKPEEIFVFPQQISTQPSPNTNLAGINCKPSKLFDWMVENLLTSTTQNNKTIIKPFDLIWFDFETINFPFTVLPGITVPYATLPVQNSIQKTNGNKVISRKNHLYVGKLNSSGTSLQEFNYDTYKKVWKDLISDLLVETKTGEGFKFKDDLKFVVYSSFEQSRIKEACNIFANCLEILNSSLEQAKTESEKTAIKKELKETEILWKQLVQLYEGDYFIDFLNPTKTKAGIFSFEGLTDKGKTGNGISIKKLQHYMATFMPELLKDLDIIQDRSQMKIHNGGEATEVLQILTMGSNFALSDPLISKQFSKEDLPTLRDNLKIYCQNDVSIMMMVYNWFQRLITLPEFKQDIEANSIHYKKLVSINPEFANIENVFKPLELDKKALAQGIKQSSVLKPSGSFISKGGN